VSPLELVRCLESASPTERRALAVILSALLAEAIAGPPGRGRESAGSAGPQLDRYRREIDRDRDRNHDRQQRRGRHDARGNGGGPGDGDGD
jgi:hypothetical protein